LKSKPSTYKVLGFFMSSVNTPQRNKPSPTKLTGGYRKKLSTNYNSTDYNSANYNDQQSGK